MWKDCLLFCRKELSAATKNGTPAVVAKSSARTAAAGGTIVKKKPTLDQALLMEQSKV